MAVCRALLGPSIETERIPCSSPGHAPDLLARIAGEAGPRLLLLGHLDTVVSHEAHRPLTAADGRLSGSGAVDMKGGVVLSLGVLRALAEESAPHGFSEVALLLVNDEEWRRHPFAHAERFAGWDACLCFEAGERGPAGEEGVVVRRKAAGTLRVEAHGTSAHSGAAPDRGRNALLALAAAAERVAAFHEPHGGERLSAGSDHPALGRRLQRRARRRRALLRPARRPPRGDRAGGRGRARRGRRRSAPGRAHPALAGDGLPRGHCRAARGRVRATRPPDHRGASAAGPATPATWPRTSSSCVDGLGPRGGGAHTPDEYVLASVAVLAGRGRPSARGRAAGRSVRRGRVRLAAIRRSADAGRDAVASTDSRGCASAPNGGAALGFRTVARRANRARVRGARLAAIPVEALAITSSFGPVANNPADALVRLPIDPYAYDRASRCESRPDPGMLALETGSTATREDRRGHHALLRLGSGYSLHAEGRALDWKLNVHRTADRRGAARLMRLLLATDKAETATPSRGGWVSRRSSGTARRGGAARAGRCATRPASTRANARTRRRHDRPPRPHAHRHAQARSGQAHDVLDARTLS